MKISVSIGWCAVVALLLSLLVANVGAKETPKAGKVAEGAAKSPARCRCQGDLGPSGERIKQVLAEPLQSTGLEFSEEPLENVVNFLQAEYNIPIQLDTLALEDAGLTTDEPVTVNLQNITLRSALRLMLRQKNLTYIIENEVLMITTRDAAEARLIVCVYDVRDILGQKADRKEAHALIDAIIACIATESWAKNGGGEAAIRVLPAGLLVISQTDAVHEEIAKLLTLIRESLCQPVQRPDGHQAGMMRGGGDYGMGGERDGEMGELPTQSAPQTLE